MSPQTEATSSARRAVITVYCGSQKGNDPDFVNAARLLGSAIGQNGLGLVYGGGNVGLMGEVAEAALRHGASVTGIIPEFLLERERHSNQLQLLGETIITANMHERKGAMFERADAFVALPGGIGTLEEIVEIMTWAQLGRHLKPMIFANINGFWSPFEALLKHMQQSGFLHSPQLLQPMMIERAEEIVPAILARLAENQERGISAASSDDETIALL